MTEKDKLTLRKPLVTAKQKQRSVKNGKRKDCKGKVSRTITYGVTDPGKDGPAIMRTIADELPRIHDATGGRIDKVVIDCHYSTQASLSSPFEVDYEKTTSLQTDLKIGEFTIRTNYRNSEYADEDSRDIKSIFEGLRRLHDELGEQIREMDYDAEAASGVLENIHAEMEMQLDALEEAFDDE
jgi:hypothetical protein